MTGKDQTDQDDAYQERILQGVSRTFALTIPQLPPALVKVVSNAYLLCRIADTIEDDKQMSFAQKREFAESFIKVVEGSLTADIFAQTLSPLLSSSNSEAELDLIHNTATVIRITHSFNKRQRQALERCIQIMADGMAKYQESNVSNGLSDQSDMDHYCYHVAGVVGEMLTELFCDYSTEIHQHYDELLRLSVSFGQGLQMTNILKDIWDDQKRDMCWLPRTVFQQYGSSIEELKRGNKDKHFQDAISHLIGIAHTHLSNAMEYTLLLPKDEVGLRRFCFYAIGMAIQTLRKINEQRDFDTGNEVKITRNSVKITILSINLLVKNNVLLRKLFDMTAKPLPRHALADDYNPRLKHS